MRVGGLHVTFDSNKPSMKGCTRRLNEAPVQTEVGVLISLAFEHYVLRATFDPH